MVSLSCSKLLEDSTEEGKLTLRSIQSMENITQKAALKLKEELGSAIEQLGEYQEKQLRPFEVRFERRDKDKIDYEIEHTKHNKEGNATKFAAAKEKYDKTNKELSDDLAKLFNERDRAIIPIARKVREELNSNSKNFKLLKRFLKHSTTL